MRQLLIIISLFLAATSIKAQTAVECLRDYYLSGITSPANLNNTRFTGIKLTVTGATSSTYLAYPVTATISGNFVKMRGNNAITANVDYTSATPTFASAGALLTFTQGCTPLTTGGTGDNWGTQTVQHDNTLLGQGILGSELKVDSALFTTKTYVSNNIPIVQATTRPTYNPSGSTQPRIWHDLTNNRVLQYKTSPVASWYTQGTVVATSAPFVSETLSGITVDNTQAEWYNPTNKVYYKYVDGAGWQSILFIDLNSIVYTTGNQTIAGEKTMTDTLRATKGLVAGTSKFTSTTSKAAVETIGVQQETYTVVSTNTVLDGTYYEIAVNTTSGDIQITLPTPSASNKGWKYIIHKESETMPNKIIISRPSASSHILYGGSKILKGTGTDWKINL